MTKQEVLDLVTSVSSKKLSKSQSMSYNVMIDWLDDTFQNSLETDALSKLAYQVLKEVP